MNITIPPEALEAGARAIHEVWRQQSSIGDDISEYRTWEQLEPEEQEMQREEARACFLAMVEAWPGMHVHEWQRPWLGGMSGADLILPLPQEKSDD